jgi:hypothetical protein
MAFPWPSKNDPGEGEIPDFTGASTSDHPAELGQLLEQFDKLGALLGQANRELADYLVRRESLVASAVPAEPPPIGLPEKLESLVAKIEQLTAKGAQRETPVPALPPAPTLDGQAISAAMKPMDEKLVLVGKHIAAQNQALGQLQQYITRGFEHLADLLIPKAEEPAPAAVVAATPTGGWEEAILGSELAANPALAEPRRQLIGGLLGGDASARALAGQLLLFQSAPVERLAQVLKDVGEAYYRWQPKTRAVTNPVEEALSAWLQQTCEAAGIHNTIELVHPGERFDSLRHNATSRGVEITEVMGWVVLRDNGKVYTKATVAVR